MSSAENKFSVPDSLNKYLDERDSERQRIDEEEMKKLEKSVTKKNREQEDETEKAKRNLEHAQTIFDWADELRRSDIWKRILNNLSEIGPLHFFTWFLEPNIYGESCAHKLFIVEKGIMWKDYRENRCRFPGSYTIHKNPKELVKYTSYLQEMLEDACYAISNGMVWKWIKKDLERRQKEKSFIERK